MSLKTKYAKKTDIPAGAEALFAEVNGEWVLQIEGMVPQSALSELQTKVGEFRDTNTKLAKQLSEFEGKKVLSAEDYEFFIKLRKDHEAQGDKELIDAGKIDELVNKRTEQMRKAHEAQITSLQTQLKDTTDKYGTVKGKYGRVLIEAEVGKVINSAGTPANGAMADIMNRAAVMWQVDDDGKIVARNSDGTPVYGKEGKELTMTEWATDLVKQAPYLFQPSQGSGARGGNQGAGSGDRGSNNKATVRISRSDPNFEKLKSQNLDALAKGTAVIVD